MVSCTPGANRWIRNENAGGALGTSYSIIYLADQKVDYQKEIDSVFAAVNRSLSTYIPDSDISKINQGDTTVVVDLMFREVLERSKEVNHKTNGYFDPTVGSLVNAWGFGPGPELVMDSLKVDSLLAFVGLDKINITDKGTITKANANVYLDFNAIAKGYAIDRLARLMDQKGIQNYLLEVGGELVAKGENRIKQKPWLVGIDDPQIEEGRGLKIMIYLKNRALASSGNYRKYRIDPLTGTKFVHTVDPKTGFTKNGNTLGVTVLADNCATADAFATAFMAMDLDEAMAYLAGQNELDAYVVYLDKQGNTQEFMTDGLKALLVE
jgi:thiamine biosynthesis lipoprotein